jgi:hypothetical protein
MVWLDLPVLMVAKLVGDFDKSSNFLFFGLKMWYRHVVRVYATVPMVVKLTGTCGTYNSCAFLHMPLYINIPTKITKEKQSI